MKLKPTPTEAELLDVLLGEIRKSARRGGQLHVLFDPFVPGRNEKYVTGGHLFVDHGAPGESWDFTGAILRGRR